MARQIDTACCSVPEGKPSAEGLSWGLPTAPGRASDGNETGSGVA
jgi:hypothetical protein